LVISWISNAINGKLDSPPTPEMLASLVLSCQRWRTEQTGGIIPDPGPGSLEEWFAVLRAACHNWAATTPPDGRAGHVCPPDTVRLTPAQRALAGSYGQYGHGLASQIEQGDPEIVYRVALLLGTHPDHVAAARELLLQAAAAFHPAATRLLDASRYDPDSLLIADLACQLADAAETAGSRAEALAYYDCAARAGHLAATLKLASTRLRDHDQHQAAGKITAIADEL
jgi:hypothetical protein